MGDGRKTDAWEAAELHPCEWQSCQKCIYCRAVRRASPVHRWALLATAAVSAYQSPLCSACHEALEPNHRNWLSCWEREKRKHARRLSAVFLFFLMLAVLSFISLWSLLHHLSGSRATFSACLGASDVKAAVCASPNNSLSTGIPLHSAEASLKHLQFCFGGGLKSAVTPFMCAPQNPFEIWLLGWTNTGHFSQSEHIMCFYRIFTLGGFDSATPLLLWKYHCCKGWQKSSSLTRSNQVVMEMFRLEKMRQRMSLYSDIPLAPGSVRKMLSWCLDIYCKYLWSPEDEPLYLCWSLTFLLAAVEQWWASVKFSDNDRWDDILWLAFNV